MRRLAAVGLLFVLAPLILEYLSGDVSPTSVFPLLGFGMLNGAAAILVREVAVRRRAGWLVLLLLGVAFAIVEEGLLDQSMFNPGFAPNWLSYGYLPALGTSWVTVVFVIGVDAVWGVLVPIALTELAVPSRAGRPWLGRVGLAVTGVVFILGCVSQWLITTRLQHFSAARPQLFAATLAATAIAVTAVAVDTPIRLAWLPHGINRGVPRPWLVALITLCASSGFLALVLAGERLGLPALITVLLLLGDAVAAGATLRRFSANPAWGSAHRLGACAGALLSYTWFGLLRAAADSAKHLLAQAVLVAAVLASIAYLARRDHNRTEHQARGPGAASELTPPDNR